jgi:hypothetical protein
MTDGNQRALAENVFERSHEREEIKDAIKSEEARRAALIANMRRLKALRLARDANARR